MATTTKVVDVLEPVYLNADDLRYLATELEGRTAERAARVEAIVCARHSIQTAKAAAAELWALADRMDAKECSVLVDLTTDATGNPVLCVCEIMGVWGLAFVEDEGK